MIDHIGLGVSDVPKSKSFFEKALAPLGYKALMDFGEAVGLGDTRPDFWIAASKTVVPAHICFAAPDRATVKAFYDAAVAAGGKDNGAPGLRPQYHPNYYGAFVLDHDGNNIEAVCHLPE